MSMRLLAMLLAVVAVTSGCTIVDDASPPAAKTDAPLTGFFWSTNVSRAPGVSLPREIVVDTSYHAGQKGTLLRYEHGAVDQAYTVESPKTWTFKASPEGTHIDGSILEDRTATRSGATSEATATLVVSGALPDGHYIVSVACSFRISGLEHFCEPTGPTTFDIKDGVVVTR